MENILDGVEQMQTQQQQTKTPSTGQWPQESSLSTETGGYLEQPPTAWELEILPDSGMNMQDEEALRLGLSATRTSASRRPVSASLIGRLGQVHFIV